MSEENSNDHVLILGGGISGLAVAWNLYKAGVSFKLIEKQPETGGVISSQVVHDTVLDFGPNSIRDRDGSIRKLAEDVGLDDQIVQISEAFKTRYIVRNGKLQGLTPSIGSLIFTKILSGKAKLRILAEPFIAKGETGDESVGDFLERRIGKEAVQYIADPVFSGIYAGDIYQMSKKAILPKLDGFEQEFGSVFLGSVRSKKEKKSTKPMVLAFRRGIQELTDAITEQLSEHIIHEEVQSVRKTERGFEVLTSENRMQSEKVISCIPAYNLSEVLEGFDPNLSSILSDIDYAPILSTQILYNKGEVDFDKSGFGFLIPRSEKIRLLGAIWKSSIFPELTTADSLHFTLMTGGARDRAILSDPVEQVEKEVLAEFSKLTGIEQSPMVVKSRLWRKAIPQFNVGYESIQSALKKAEEENPGFYIGGNYRWGVSVPDCVKESEKLVQKIIGKEQPRSVR